MYERGGWFKVVLFLVLMLFSASSVLAAQYTVKKDGGGDFNTLQACANSAQAGDTCLVYPGIYEEETFTKRSGSSGNMITFKAQGNAVLRKFSVDHNYIRIEGFEFTNMDSSFTGDAINMKGKYNEIINNYFHHLEGAYDGIDSSDGLPEYRSAKGVDCSKSSGCDYSLIKGNTITWVHSAGIYIYGTGVIVEDNEISHVVQRFSTDHSPHFDADGIRFFGTNHVIRNNYIHDIVNDEYAPAAHTDCFQTYDNSAPSTQNILITGNVCVNVDHQCIMASQGTKGNGNRIIFTNNVCDNNGGQAVNIQGFPNSVINNNVFYKNIQYRAVYIRFGNTNTEVKNNIFYGPLGATIQKDSSSSSGFSADYNLVYNIDGDHISGPNDVQGNPLFVDPSGGDFHVSQNSPACGAGEGGSDIGAFPCGASQTCSQLGGTACNSNEFCQGGSFQYSSDFGSLCCVGGSCSSSSQTCSDGTLYGQCSINKPIFCDNGDPRDDCQQCGCSSGETCNPDGSCNLGGISPDTDGDGCVSFVELFDYIALWKQGLVGLTDLFDAIVWWKQGC